ncbi:hypothetical protein DH2020_043787 [Rehmannia glutinosa]|uniref:DBC1/CARP1 catalytically inactive NUDIX hydrolase domain-containing protein n=1 Tax=Rehmannia glutinosa TaxID=99300 RepID=A0ABR0UJX9_REHGL
MYSSRGSNGYGQEQPYSSQGSYAPQNLGAAALLGGALQETELGGYRTHGHVHGRPSAAAAAVTAPPSQLYGGEYSSIYGSAAQQISPLGMKGSVTTAFEGRSNYGSSMPESPKFATNEYVSSSSRGYGQKMDQLYSDRTSEYPSVERRQYADRHSAYLGRDLPSETANRYAESVAFGHEHQSKLYDRLEQTTALRQDEMLKARTLQSASVEGGARQADYLAARATVRHPAQDPIAYGGRLDPDLHGLSTLSGSSYGGKHTASILGAAPQRNLDDLIYAQKIELKRKLELKHEPTPPRVSRDRRASSKDIRSLRRESPRREVLHRLHSPVKEKRREYDCKNKLISFFSLLNALKFPLAFLVNLGACNLVAYVYTVCYSHSSPILYKPLSFVASAAAVTLLKDVSLFLVKISTKAIVFSFSFVQAERDYLSLDKRYPRLRFSRMLKGGCILAKKNLQLSLYTPVSFEHDFVEEAAAERKESPSTQPTTDISGAGGQTTLWNAKIILMSGLGKNAQAELSSERTYNDRIPHFCNMLRFAVLKKNSSLMAIGGPWDTIDGGDPSVDDSSLIRTALRYAKDVTNLDLKNCRHWNRFLEIHYDRVGKDGLFSHKEVTVLYVPDLSDCLPSLDSWRDQWFNHKKAVSERERLRTLTKEVPGDKEEGPKDKKKLEQPKDSTAKIEPQKKKEGSSSGPSGNDSKKENDASKQKGKANLVFEEGKEKDKAVENKDVVGSTEEEKNVPKKAQGVDSDAQPTAVGAKTGKKKIIKRIVKKKVAKKKDGAENATEQNEQLEKEGAEGKSTISEVDGQQDGSSSNPTSIKTFIRKKVVKKPVNAAMEKDESSNLEVKTDKAPENAAGKEKVKSEDSNAVVQEGSAKTTVKKKVIKRVPKRKAPAADKVAEDDQKGEKIIRPEGVKGEQKEEAVEKLMNEVISKDTNSPKMKPDKKEERKADMKDVSGSAMETDSLHSLSLSLDSLLDYNDKDIEDSTFELSLFAESFYEMLQYEMGSRLLAFLQKLRIKFVAKRKQGKRERKETSEKEKEESSSRKRVKTGNTSEDPKSTKTENKTGNTSEDTKSTKTENKTGNSSEDMKSTKTETTDDAHRDDSNNIKEETKSAEQVDTAKIEDEIEEEDPEEDPEEDEQMPDANPHHESTKEARIYLMHFCENLDEEKKAADSVGEDVAQTEQNKQQETAKQTSENISSIDPSNKDKSSFQELVQSALLESNTGRDDRILYDKLVKMSDITGK